MNINYYTEKYQLYKFASKKLLDFYNEFEQDFINDFVGINRIIYKSQLQFNTFKNTINKSIQILINLETISQGNLPINIIWKTLFIRKIQPYTIKYFPETIDDSYFNLQFIFDRSPKNINTDKNDKADTTTVTNEYMNFMGLKPNFTKTELIRRFRQLCILLHPDKTGGSSDMFIQLKKCKTELEIYLTTLK